MKIENSQMLQTQMDMGANLKLNSHGDIKTQGKISKGLQSFCDHFRGAESINARNERLMVAIGAMLRDGGAAPLNGPQNLAAPRAMGPFKPVTALQNAQKAIMKSAIDKHIEATYGQQHQNIKDAVLHHITERSLTQDPKNLTELKKAVNDEIARSEKNSASYVNNFSKTIPLSAKSSEDLAPQRAYITNAIKESLAGDIGTHKNYPNNIYNTYSLDSHRSLPIFQGTQTKRENHDSTLTQFSQNPVEARMLGYLCSQTSLVPFLAVAMGAAETPLSELHADPTRPLSFSVANGGVPFSVSRATNNDVFITKSLKGQVQGMVDDVPYKVENLGTLDYTIRIPHAQFAGFADANEELAKLETQAEKDTYMTTLLANFKPQLEVTEMTVTPPNV